MKRITGVPTFVGTLRSGFTILELLIVIAIIGILITIAMASYATAEKKSRDSRRVSDMKSMQSAWELFFAGNNENYPGVSSSVPCSLALVPTPATYLPEGFPIDPKSGTNYPAMYDGWSRCTKTTYCFCAGMEVASSINSATDCTGVATVGYAGFYCVKNLQ